LSTSKTRRHLFLQNRFTPVNTSKTTGRASGASCAMPALFLCPVSRLVVAGGAA
jgi:hypothetical protein